MAETVAYTYQKQPDLRFADKCLTQASVPKIDSLNAKTERILQKLAQLHGVLDALDPDAVGPQDVNATPSGLVVRLDYSLNELDRLRSRVEGLAALIGQL